MLKTTVMDTEKIYEKAFMSPSIKFMPETFKKGPGKYVMSIMEPLDGYSPLHEIFDRNQRKMRKLRLEPGDVRVILFQVMYTIQCMTMVNMAHMDLHFGNIMAKFIPSNVGKYREYVFLTKDGVLRKAFVPAHYDVKIIDLDGAHKLDTRDDVVGVLRKGIPNKHMFTGRVTKTNPRTNAMKIMFELKRYSKRKDISTTEFAEMTNKNGKIPYIDKNILKHPAMAHRNVGFVNNFGLFMNRRDKLLPLNDKMISHPSVIVENMAKHFTTEPDRSVIIDTLSQAEIFTKIPSVKPKPAPKPATAPPKPKRAKKMGTTSGYRALVATIKNILLVHKDDVMNLRHVPKKFVMRKQDMSRFVKNEMMVVDVEHNVVVPVTQRDMEAYVIAGEKLWMGALGRLYVKVVPGLEVALNDDKAWYQRPTNTPKLTKGINDVCGPPRRGRPTKQCSAILKKMREKCESRDMGFKKRECVPMRKKKV
jgi:hypothetical protein